MANFEFSSCGISRDGYTVPDRLQILEMTDFTEKKKNFIGNFQKSFLL